MSEINKNMITIKPITFNKELNEIFNNVSVFHVDAENLDIISNSNMITNLNQSKVIIIQETEKYQEDNIFLISFKNTVIIIKQFLLGTLQKPIFNILKLPIFFLTKDAQKNFRKNVKILDDQIKSFDDFKYEIKKFEENVKIKLSKQTTLSEFPGIEEYLKTSISAYLIGESYIKINNNQRNIYNQMIDNGLNIKSMTKSDIKISEFDENDFYELTLINSENSEVYLSYYIKTRELFVIKKFKGNDIDYLKLIKREIENYRKIDFPLLPKFYGRIKKTNSFVIQFINGRTLMNIREINLNDEDKILIILELILIIEYFHNNHFVYRDLKPNNVIIDENKSIYVIDFDRMINIDNIENNDENHTNNFRTEYIAPEVNSGQITYKNDIYSLGKMIDYITKDKLEIENIIFYKKIIAECTDNCAEKRPCISDLKKQFLVLIFRLGIECQYITRDINRAIYYYKLAANQNDPKAQFSLGTIYLRGEYIKQDIKNAIHYYSLAANQNDPKAQFSLGIIYYSGEYVTQDINKSIHYLLLAANQNHPDAQFNLGTIYYSGKYIKRDINKAIYYYTLASNQNFADAQFNLGTIYYSGKYIKRDINKAIYYFSLATNQNHPQALFNLGLIYYSGRYIKRDINKAIYYYTLAANQNQRESQFNLGKIYDDGKYIKRDINKAIYYYSLAANQNDPKAQFNLGFFYFKGEFITRDINKTIYYYTLAANQNHIEAQLRLGLIYSRNEYVTRDINKAIYYYSLAANQNDLDAQFNLGCIYYEGKYITRDINKAIHYYSLAANQNHLDAQFQLGIIYYSDEYNTRDIYKAIYYFQLAANQNDLDAQLCLGFIFSEEYKTRDINKAIFYYSLSANQNNSDAQFSLGLIYDKGEYITRDINKAIYYYSLAANQNHPGALFNLGLIYDKGEYITQDINKAIYYYSRAANQNQREAQFNLGVFYIEGIDLEKNMIKGIDLLIQSSSNKLNEAHFPVGYFYHEGKDVSRDIKKAIYYYKEGSTFNDEYAKNNLGVIYKNGIDNEINQNIGLAMSYFEEAINRFNNEVSMYNLAHIFIYEDQMLERINESIKLLINSLNKNFKPSKELLCIALIKIHGSDIQSIKEELKNQSNELFNQIYKMIKDKKLENENDFDSFYQKYKKIDFLYNYKHDAIVSNSINEPEIIQIKNTTAKDITSAFYEGFGI